MQGEEKIYFRKSLGVECSSTQAAYSYLDGRVDQKEIFLLDGKEMFFSDIFVQDELVRKIVRAHKTLDELFPPHKQKTFSERYALFKKIVLRGDDSSALFLAELDEKKEQLSKQRVELKSCRSELCFYKKSNEKLVGSSKNAIQTLRYLALIIESQKKNLSAYSNSFIHDSGILATIKQLTENLGEAMGWNVDAAVEPENEQQAIRTLEIINDFREKTDCEIRARKTELEQLTASANAKINADRESVRKEKEKILQEMKDAKAKAFYEIQEERSLCEQEIQEAKEKERTLIKEWKNSVMASLQIKVDELSALRNAAGKYELSVREYAKKLFNKLSVSSPRYYAFPVPEKILYNSIRSCVDNGKLADVAPRDVLAVFDCSRMKNGTCGILVSTHAFYLFNEEIKKKYQLHRDNKINPVLKKSKWRTYWAWCGGINLIFSFVLVVFYYKENSFLFPLFTSFFSFLLAFLSAPKIMIKCNGVVMLTYSQRRTYGIERFCDNINELCTSLWMTKEEMAEIEKIKLDF